MIHAYNEQFLPVVQEKFASMFELAVLEGELPIDDFAERFLASPVCAAMEKADPVYVLGKSANELLALVLDTDPIRTEPGSFATPEYWTGWVLAYTQWYLNQPFTAIINAFPCGKLVEAYFPYHEMDIMHSVELIRSKLTIPSPLKLQRKKKGFSQNDLAALSNVPVRSIKAYEQGTADIAKAQAETLYALSKTLGCTIEDLIR